MDQQKEFHPFCESKYARHLLTLTVAKREEKGKGIHCSAHSTDLLDLLDLVLQKPVKEWTIEDVKVWVTVQSDAETAEKLRWEEFNGPALLLLNEKVLLNHPCNLKGGLASNLACAIEKLKEPGK